MEFQKSEGRIFSLGEDGKVLAEVTFPTVEDGVRGIKFVDACLKSDREGNIWTKVV